jgi:transmembrane sensor
MDANERRARATHEATQWWNRLSLQRPAEISKTDRESFTQWLRESPLHVAELLRIAQVHDALERFKLWNEVEADVSSEPHNVVPLRELADASEDNEAPPRSGVSLWVMAACACFVAILGAWLAIGMRGQVIETDLAERRQVMLDDGTVVQLEPETKLRVKFEDNLRRVTLERGRALFRVSKNPQRPFLVSADHTSVRAVGTAFGVENGKRGVVVTVAEGKVAVARGKGSAVLEQPIADSAGARDGKTAAAEVFLTAGQQVTVPSSGVVNPVRAVDTTRALAWAEGQLVFENDTLADVVGEFNRYNRTQLTINDSELATRKVSGVFEATDTETLLAFIRQGGADISVTQTDDGIVIDARR